MRYPCLVVGDEVVAAIERRAKEGDSRSNLHRGGAVSVASITPQERERDAPRERWRWTLLVWIFCVLIAGRW